MQRVSILATVMAGALFLAGCADPAAPDQALAPESASFAAASQSCWGQATKVFAQTGEMGPHSSQQANPRLGLANLARYLYNEGVIPEPTLQALGAWVAAELGLSIDACLSV
jgi:hypothetical protein